VGWFGALLSSLISEAASLALPVVIVILIFVEWFDALSSSSIQETSSFAHQ
jgi:hypothetical protein